ncbi:MAG: SgcJ/EcaC family oxidoreductase [Alphaproteobacteria bacterium]|nr:SgcJ/EcaC family oxidoreductase [Alphaproteobacteria bacterium]
MRIVPYLLAALAMTLPARADVAADLSARKQAVIDAYNAADIDALAANYTDDAWHISPRRPPAVGRAAIAAYFAPAMKFYTMVSSAKVLNVNVSGDTAVMISENSLTGMPRPGAASGDKSPPAFTESRINLTVFKKQTDGRWLIDRFIDTTPPDAPR